MYGKEFRGMTFASRGERQRGKIHAELAGDSRACFGKQTFDLGESAVPRLDERVVLHLITQRIEFLHFGLV